MKTYRIFMAATLASTLALAGLLQGYAAKIYEPYTFTTIAGKAGYSGGVDGTNNAARFNDVQGLAMDSAGSLYVAEWLGCSIRKVTPIGTNWVVTTLAGKSGVTGSADGPGNTARFNNLGDPAVDKAGNIYVPDNGNHTIRKVTQVGTNWVVTTLAGKTAYPGSTDGTNSAARFNGPSALAVDSAGNIYLTDAGNNTIRKVTPVGTNWVVTTLAGKAGYEGSVDGTGSAARFTNPFGIAMDSAGNLYVADFYAHTIRKVAPVGTNWVVTTIAGKAATPDTVDGIGSVARFTGPLGVAVDSAGSVYVTEWDNHTIRKVTPVGTNWMVTTLAGKAGVSGSANGTGSAALFKCPADVIVDGAGRLYVTDGQNQTIRMGYPALTFAASGAGFGFNGGQFGFSLKGGPAGQMAVVETSADMVNWLPIWTNTLGGTLNFSDPQSASQSNRFYRAQTK